MLIVNAVLETPDTADFPFWPVAELPPYRFMALSGRMSPLQVGTALAMLADYNSRTSDDDRPMMDAGDMIRRLLETETVIAPGGLRVHDTRTNVAINPGCCCGLEDWREWLDIADGESPWLGHDPSPRLEQADDVVRLWPDGGDTQGASAGPPIEIVVGDLPRILHTVQEGLNGFLSLITQWATAHIPTLAVDLTARLDEGLAISAPLPGADDQHVL
ncbi:hypothetical protein [Streptomyces sp. NPDC048650]|uniref:hypothetical protein n=1 Tax=Streptomyces sp. NPDC048650 TaxID=3365583 RepID=UPI00371AE69C